MEEVELHGLSVFAAGFYVADFIAGEGEEFGVEVEAAALDEGGEVSAHDLLDLLFDDGFEVAFLLGFGEVEAAAVELYFIAVEECPSGVDAYCGRVAHSSSAVEEGGGIIYITEAVVGGDVGGYLGEAASFAECIVIAGDLDLFFGYFDGIDLA